MKKLMGAVLGVALFLVAGAWAQTGQDDLLNTVDAKLLKKLRAQTGRDNAQLYQKLGFSYFKQEEFDRAFLYFNAAVQLNPKLYWSWYYLGLLNLEDAETYFEKAISANVRFAPAYYWLAKTYEKKGEKAEALKALNDYLKVAGSNPEEAKRVQEAKEMLSRLQGRA